MIDAILYVPNFSALVATLDADYPDLLERDDSGAIAKPPTVTGFARTPAVVSGGELMTYARLTDDEANQWRGIDGVQILAETEFDGPGTADRLYEALFADAGAQTIYDRVYPRPVQELDDGEGGVIEYRRPERFGMMAGA